tara:strand:+ start:370 stop:585 length:216 start_codon:yes stop_codon:yes gene_type:complete
MKLNKGQGNIDSVIEQFNEVAYDLNAKDILNLMITEWAEEDDLEEIGEFLLNRWADDHDLIAITDLIKKHL